MEEEIYKQNILEHYRHPHNKRRIDGAHIEHSDNPSCGDTLSLFLLTEDGVITDVSFEGDGCAVSMAAASLLTDKIKGKNIEDIKLMTPGDIYDMLGISISPARSKCALLAYSALIGALKQIK